MNYKLHKIVGKEVRTEFIITICQILCLVPYRCKCIRIFFTREMLMLNYAELIGMSEPNLRRSFLGRKVFKIFGIGGCEEQM